MINLIIIIISILKYEAQLTNYDITFFTWARVEKVISQIYVEPNLHKIYNVAKISSYSTHFKMSINFLNTATVYRSKSRTQSD